MKKFFLLAILAFVGVFILVSLATEKAAKIDAERNSLAASLIAQNQNLMTENQDLQRQLVQAQSIQPVMEAAANNFERDNKTLNTLVRWNTFQWDIRAMLLLMIILLVIVAVIGIKIFARILPAHLPKNNDGLLEAPRRSETPSVK